jgi:tetratricopeptide (TPR) repeat protein
MLTASVPFWQRGWFFILFLFLATLLAYLPMWHAGFIWDDDYWINNPLTKSPHGWYRFWYATKMNDYYPLTSSAFWLEWRLWGANAAGYHVVNVLIHATNAVLLWRLLARLDIPGAKLAAAIFALHPVNVASVAWIAELKDTLAMFFLLLSLLFYLRFDDTCLRRWYWISAETFVLALLSKSAVAPLPLVLLGIMWWRRGRIGWKDLVHSAAFFVAAGVLALITIWFQSHNSIGHEIVRTDGFWSRLAIAGRVVWFYLYKAVLPMELIPIYPQWQIGPVSVISFVPGLMLALVFFVCWKNRATWGKGPLFGLGCFVVMLLPVLGFLNISYFVYSLVADHWQYFAITGIIALMAAGITKVLDLFPGEKVLLCGVLLLVLGGLTWRQAKIYRDSETLWQTTLEQNPNCAVAHNGLGNALLQKGAVDEAITQFQQALQINPDYAQVHYDLGNALLQEGEVDKAITQFQQALEINPDYAEADNNLGSALLQKGSVDEAISHFQMALKIKTDDAEAYNNMGNALLQEGKADEAITRFQQALQINPDYTDAYNNLGNALLQKGNADEAIVQFQLALKIDPDNAATHYNLGNAMLQKGNVDGAIVDYKTAVQNKPDYADAENNLGSALLQKGNVDEAILYFQKALQLELTDPQINNNLGSALLQKGSVDEAIARFQTALQLNPNYANAHFNLGNALLQKANFSEAIAEYEKALQSNPNDIKTLNNLAWVLATCQQASLRDGSKAVELAQLANQLTGNGNPSVLNTLAAAYAETGRFPEAVVTAKRALQLAGAQPNPVLIDAIKSELTQYQAGIASTSTEQRN